jgi:hypothetical protein
MLMAPVSRSFRVLLGTAMALSAVLMATTSSELGGLLANGQGHKIAQAYGMFLWAGVVVYLATAWRVWVERSSEIDDTIGYEDRIQAGTAMRAPHSPLIRHKGTGSLSHFLGQVAKEGP